jgi:hypothetical protein
VKAVTSNFQPIPLQQAAIDLVKSSDATNLLFYGGGRSGKSIVISYIILMRAMAAPGSKHGIFRRTATAARATLFKLAFPKACELTFGREFLANPKNCTINSVDMTITLANGSIISFGGVEEHNRDRILGEEYETIWLNECTEFEYDDYTFLKSRLSGVTLTSSGRRMRPIVFSDLNPDLKTHYTYQCWIAKKNPARNVPLRDPDDWVSLQMNLAEDADHVSASYREGLMDGSDADIQRFVSGYWRDEREHSLFRPSVVNRFRVQAPPADLRRIVVAVDPAISSHEGSDETGIVVAAEAGDGDYYVLADYSLKGAPKEWAAAAVQAYHDWEADRIVAEQNQGGLMVSETLRHASRNVPVKLVHASRGKVIRAEPISALYADGRVHHVGEFKELERQMFAFHSSYDRRKEGSPDRLDALVWAVTELAVAPAPSRHVASGKVAGRYG